MRYIGTIIGWMAMLLCGKVEGQVSGQSAVAHPLVVVMLGPPGSGKGTQAVRLSDTFGLPHISTGDLFRKNLQEGTALGKKVRDYLDKGQLVPDALVLDMLFERLAQPDCAKGYILDGFPRTVAQAKALEGRMDKNARVLVFNLEISDEAVVKRLSGRRVCPECGRVYHIEASPPKVAGVCDTCGAHLVQRSDDTEAVIRERLKVYHAQTKPVEGFYREHGQVIDVNSEEGSDMVFGIISATIYKAEQPTPAS